MLTGANSHVWVVLFGVCIGVAHRPPALRRDRQRAEMACAGAVCLRDHGDQARPHWGASSTTRFIPSLPRGSQAMEHSGCDPRDDHLPLSLFLAGVPGSRRGKGAGTASLVTGAAPPRAKCAGASGCRRRHVLLEHGDVLHHPDYGADAARARHHESDIEREVAEALQPLAGNSAALLYTIGLVGTGALAIPTLAAPAPTRSRNCSAGDRAWTNTSGVRRRSTA